MGTPSGGQSWVTELGGQDPEALKLFIRKLLKDNHGDVTKTANAAGISRQFFWYTLRKYGMGKEPAQVRAELKTRFRLPPLSQVATWLQTG